MPQKKIFDNKLLYIFPIISGYQVGLYLFIEPASLFMNGGIFNFL